MRQDAYTLTLWWLTLSAHLLLLKGYYLKRISKGYVFRVSPKPWEALLEKPEGGLEALGKYNDKPLLRDAAKVRTKLECASLCGVPPLFQFVRDNHMLWSSHVYPWRVVCALHTLNLWC